MRRLDPSTAAAASAASKPWWVIWKQRTKLTAWTPEPAPACGWMHQNTDARPLISTVRYAMDSGLCVTWSGW